MIEKALRLTREFHRIKQIDLAKKLDISPSYLNEIERGKKAPSLAILEGYSKIFGVPASTFLIFKEKSETTSTKSSAAAARLLQFFEWVNTNDAEDCTDV